MYSNQSVFKYVPITVYVYASGFIYIIRMSVVRLVLCPTFSSASYINLYILDDNILKHSLSTSLFEA